MACFTRGVAEWLSGERGERASRQFTRVQTRQPSMRSSIKSSMVVRIAIHLRMSTYFAVAALISETPLTPRRSLHHLPLWMSKVTVAFAGRSCEEVSSIPPKPSANPSTSNPACREP